MVEFIPWREALRLEDEKHPERAEIIARNMKTYLDESRKNG
jgi:hypothetical protein